MNPAALLALISELYAQVSALSQERDHLLAQLSERADREEPASQD